MRKADFLVPASLIASNKARQLTRTSSGMRNSHRHRSKAKLNRGYEAERILFSPRYW
jgi:hypothetical protein